MNSEYLFFVWARALALFADYGEPDPTRYMMKPMKFCYFQPDVRETLDARFSRL